MDESSGGEPPLPDDYLPTEPTSGSPIWPNSPDYQTDKEEKPDESSGSDNEEESASSDEVEESASASAANQRQLRPRRLHPQQQPESAEDSTDSEVEDIKVHI